RNEDPHHSSAASWRGRKRTLSARALELPSTSIVNSMKFTFDKLAITREYLSHVLVAAIIGLLI
ncbi:MAG: hypothetical protein WBG23_00410, partial [Acidobacteriaceae bacterium]